MKRSIYVWHSVFSIKYLKCISNYHISELYYKYHSIKPTLTIVLGIVIPDARHQTGIHIASSNTFAQITTPLCVRPHPFVCSGLAMS